MMPSENDSTHRILERTRNEFKAQQCFTDAHWSVSLGLNLESAGDGGESKSGEAMLDRSSYSFFFSFSLA